MQRRNGWGQAGISGTWGAGARSVNWAAFMEPVGQKWIDTADLMSVTRKGWSEKTPSKEGVKGNLHKRGIRQTSRSRATER